MSRANHRFDKRLKVDFLVSVVSTGGHRLSRASNLSSGGIQLERDIDTLVPGADFELGLRLPEAPGPVMCAGTVVYARGPVAGVSFTHVPPHGQAAIDSFIESRLARRS
jgi:hypothetical protein